MIPREDRARELQVGDRVRTDFSGPWTFHTVVAVFTGQRSQTGITVQVSPKVPKSSGKPIDCAWFVLEARP